MLIRVSSHLILRKTFIDYDSFTLKFYVIGVDEIIGAKDFTHLVGKKLGFEPWALGPLTCTLSSLLPLLQHF